MGVFGDVERIFHLVGAFDSALHPRDGRILVRPHVDDVVVALVLYGARGVEGLDGVVAVHEVLARSGLVAEAPDADRGVVDGGVNHLHVACNVCVLELRHVGEAGFAVVVLVALDVGFVLKIDAVFVAEVVPVGRVGVVAVAHVVDVAALHEEHFLLHLLARYVMSRLRVVFVTVHTLHLDGLAVEVVVASGQSELIL